MIRLFSATLLSLLLCASLANAAEKPLIVASDATWPPIEMLDENKNVVGYSIDYLKAVAKEAGLNVEFRNTAWDGIFAALESRQADIIASSVTITDKRKKAMGFSDPYCEIRQAVVVSTTGPQNLKGLDGQEGRRPDRYHWPRGDPAQGQVQSHRQDVRRSGPSPSKTSPRATSTQ